MPTELSENSSANKEKIWKAHIKACSRSGLSRKEYCRRHSLSYHAFYYWKKKLFPQTGPGPDLVAVPLRKSSPAGESNMTSSLKVEIGGRFKVEVREGFSRQTLARVISTLEECK
ncbi:MAG: hypothetical protein KGY38_06575 [Desulfobacterales bacterium]|nr:hypothetical protein [Desulfobacterales bacterium]